MAILSNVLTTRIALVDKFFQLIRRLNQLIVLGLLLFGCVLAVILAKQIFFRHYKDDATASVIKKEVIENSTDTTTVQKVVELRHFKKIIGTDLFTYEVFENHAKIPTGVYSSTSYNIHRNTIFISSADHKTRLLLPTYTYAILDQSVISYSLGESSDPKSRELNYYKILKSDPNSDGQQDSDEKISLYFSRFNGAEIKEVLADIESLLSIDFIEPTKISVLYKKDGQVYSAFFSVKNFEMIGNESLIDLNPSSL